MRIYEEVEKLINTTEESIPTELLPDLPPTQYTNGAPQWHDFEHHIWRNGENIRQLLLKKTSLRRNRNLQQSFVGIATNACAKRGRQSFILLLGYVACQKHAKAIASQLEDPDVSGHVIDTLLKMRASDYIEEIMPYAQHETTWIRNKAKDYIKRYGKAV